MRLKSLYIMRLERYPHQKLPTNFSDEAYIYYLLVWYSGPLVQLLAWSAGYGDKLGDI